MAKKAPVADSDKPQIERLITELSNEIEYNRYGEGEKEPNFLAKEQAELSKATEKLEKAEREIEAAKEIKLKPLKEAKDHALWRVAQRRAMVRKKFHALRRRYRAYGATPKIVAEFQKFVEEIG